MKLPMIVLTAAALAALSGSVAAQIEFGSSKLGDLAPALNVKFLKGEPVNLEKGRGNHVYIVEFWATWCAPCKYSIPHLTELQEKYRDDGLIVIGISDETESEVRPFLEHMGDTMAYTVAVDRGKGTKPRYMDAYGEKGIPRAFVVDVNGRVVWYGNPLKPFLDKIVATLLEDIPKDASAYASSAQEEDETGAEAAEEGNSTAEK